MKKKIIIYVLGIISLLLIGQSNSFSQSDDIIHKIRFGKEPIIYEKCQKEIWEYISKQDLYVEYDDSLYIIDSMVVYFFHMRGRIEEFMHKGSTFPRTIIEYLKDDEKYRGGTIYFGNVYFTKANKYLTTDIDRGFVICHPDSRDRITPTETLQDLQEKERLEKEKQEKEKLEIERLEKERLDKEKLEKESQKKKCSHSKP
jgi:hypothetical protein